MSRQTKLYRLGQNCDFYYRGEQTALDGHQMFYSNDLLTKGLRKGVAVAGPEAGRQAGATALTLERENIAWD